MSRLMRFAVVGCGMLVQSQHLPNIVRSSRMVLEVRRDISEHNSAACQAKFHPQRGTTKYHVYEHAEHDFSYDVERRC